MKITLMLLLIVLLCLQPSLVPAVGNRDALATSRGRPRGYYAERYNYQRANPKLVPSNLTKSHIRLSDARYDRSEGRVESDITTRYPPLKPEDVKIFIGVFVSMSHVCFACNILH